MTPADRPDPAGPRTAEVGEASGPDGPVEPVEPVDTVELTPTASELLRKLHAAHGPLMFHQSGGCCDGSAPMCYPAGEFRTGRSDVLLASLAVAGVEEPVPFWMSTSQYELWRHTRLIVDVVEGRGSGFSLEAPEGVRFLIRSRLI
ncbi:UDP-glucose 4-epimerase [Streptomyces xanthochromogenes]|uniref:UDP-glucose 4-epimerase n=1 Tax=Streptomyces xanthochromogenes TaxID=67384 RepID=A0ABQ3AA51_9ACTN|nr:UDP-glucose 4-epimerase [Streptomyces xanthochromogenes]